MTYQVSTRECPEQAVLSVREVHATSGLPGFIGRSFRELFGRLAVLGVQPVGPPFVVYHRFGPDGVDAEVCVAVPERISAIGRISSRVVPAGQVATTLHVGPYEQLGSAYAALDDWLRDHGFDAAGPMTERYLNGPGDVASAADYRTELEVPIAPMAAVAGA